MRLFISVNFDQNTKDQQKLATKLAAKIAGK